MNPKTSQTRAHRRMIGTMTTAMTLVAAVAASGLLATGTTSYAAPADLTARSAGVAEHQVSSRAPRVRIGQLITRSSNDRYRFKGRKGQRVILMPDGWPQASHGCTNNATLRRGHKKLGMGAIGDWRLPRTGTYQLRIGEFCVNELRLRLRRYQQPTREIGDRLPTRLTRKVMRSVQVRLPAKRTVVLEQEDTGDWVFVTNAKPNNYPFTGCPVHVLTAGFRSDCAAGRKHSRRVIVSAPAPSTVTRASIVRAQVDGPPVTVEDPGSTLVQVDVPRRTALRLEGMAVPHADVSARPWASLSTLGGDGDGWDVTEYQVENPDGTRLPSGWVVHKRGRYVFQLNRHLVGEGSQTLAVRTSQNPPSGQTRW